LENRRAEQGLPGDLKPVGVGEVGKGYKRVNMVKILCTHDCKWKKKISVETVSQMGKGWIKENSVGT
jgi:hypothetical protein